MDDIPMWTCPICERFNAIGLDKCRCGELRPAAFSIKFIEPQSPLGLELLELSTPSPPKQRKSPSRGEKGASKKAPKPTKKSKLEEDFFSKWQTLGTGHLMERQYAIKSKRHFTPVKRIPKLYKIDFCIVSLGLCIEIQGGQWSNGRHQRGAGYGEDRKRVRDLTFEGWTVLEYTTDDIQEHTVYATIAEVIEFVYRLIAQQKVRAA